MDRPEEVVFAGYRLVTDEKRFRQGAELYMVPHVEWGSMMTQATLWLET